MSALLVLWAKGMLLMSLALAASYLPKLTASARHLVLLMALLGLPLIPSVAEFSPMPIKVSAPETFLNFEPSLPELSIAGDKTSTAATIFVWRPAIEDLGFLYVASALLIIGYWLMQLGRTVNWFNRTQSLSDPLVERLKSLGKVPVHVQLRQAPGIGSPLTWGITRPYIVVPSDWQTWPEEKRIASLVHEGAHIYRYDTLTGSVGMLISCLFWINPLAWFARARMLQLAERACDDVVVTGGVAPEDYAGQLLSIARAKNHAATAAMASGSLLYKRIEALLN